MKTNHKNQLFAVLLVLTVSLSTASCSAHKRKQPEVTIPPTAPEATAQVEGTEPSIPAETAPHATLLPVIPTEPLTTKPSAIPTEPPVQEPQPGIPAETVPPIIPTEPSTIPTETPETEPPVVPTDPPATEPPATDPIGCQHIWQSVQHPEEGHYVGYAVCKCGYRCNGANDWFSHRDSFCLEDALVYHTSYGVGEEYIVDSPADTTWVCTKCGASSDTQP